MLPHVANGDNVGQHCFRPDLLPKDISEKSAFNSTRNCWVTLAQIWQFYICWMSKDCVSTNFCWNEYDYEFSAFFSVCKKGLWLALNFFGYAIWCKVILAEDTIFCTYLANPIMKIFSPKDLIIRKINYKLYFKLKLSNIKKPKTFLVSIKTKFHEKYCFKKKFYF
jgi:hypothetical protein